MAKYTSIKKSKNLRFKFLTLMYLIFLVMAMQQVSVNWLPKINPPIQESFKKPGTAFEDSTLLMALNQLKAAEENFALRNQNTTQVGPNYLSYTETEEYFLNQKHSKDIFDPLIVLNDWASKLPNADPRKVTFEKLFKQDLEFGLSDKNIDEWEIRKFRRVPVDLAITLIKELQLRTMLLSEAEIVQQSTINEPVLSLMVKYRSLRVGDNAMFSVKGDSLKTLIITRNGLVSNDYEILGQGFVFKPTSSGLFEIIAEGVTKKDKVVIEVLPAGFPSRPALPLRICYKGITYHQSIAKINQSRNIKIQSNQASNLTYVGGLLTFTPTKEGWCRITLSNDVSKLFDDSVYVKELPDPKIKINNFPFQNTNKKRLSPKQGIEISAFHPAFTQNQPYEILGFKLRQAGKINADKVVKGKTLQLTQQEINDLSALIFYDFEVKMGLDIKTINQNLVLQLD